MTENQLFCMSTEYFDGTLNSNTHKSNNSRPFTHDLYSTVNSNGGLTTANTNTTSVVFSNLNKNYINNNNSSSSSCNSNSNSKSDSNSSTITSITYNTGFKDRNCNDSNNNINSGNFRNAMLSNAISIPRNTSANQNHHAFQDDIRHHHHHHHLSFSPYLRCHQLYQQRYQQQLDQEHFTTKDNDNNNNIQMASQMLPANNSLKTMAAAANQQTNSSQAMSTDYNDFTDYGLDALDASSLSPTLLQDVNLSAATQNTQICNGTITGTTSMTNSPFYLPENTSSPLSQSYNGASSSSAAIAINSNTVDISGAITLLGTGNINVKDDTANTLLYEGEAASSNPNNIIWNDIDSTNISMKNEPFTLEDDYIFAIDKNEISDAGFVDIGIVGAEDQFLDNIAIEEFFHASGVSNGGSNGSNACFLTSSSPFHNFATNTTSSPDMGPPLELMQQQQEQQKEQRQQHQQTQQQLVQLQNVSTMLMLEGGNDGTNSPTNAVLQQHQQQANSPSQYDTTYYKKSPLEKVKLAGFSPASQTAHSPTMQFNSITPPLSVNAIRSQFHQQQQQQQRQQQQQLQMQDMLRKGFGFSPDTNGSNPLLGQSTSAAQAMLFSNQSTISPSSASSGFGSTSGGNHSSFMETAPAISISNNNRKPFYLTLATNEATALSRLSSSAPTHLGREHIWMRREPRQHLLSTGSLAEAESFSSLSTVSILSPDAHDYSQDDDDDASSDDNSDNYDDLSSDNGSDNEDELQSTIRRRTSSLGSNQQHLSSSKAKERYFWQYNVQAKGPKGKRLVFQCKVEDPHVLNEITDPVFSPNCSVKGIKVYKHSGKARKGDGNDLTPNPRKLHNIGKELDRLSRTINDMTPVSELPFNARPKSRKEKNKLASRACRLKKKAQHEANKIKLYGLEIEHKRLLNAISDIKQALIVKYSKQNAGESVEDINQEINSLYTNALSGIAIAGVTTDFVNKVLDNIKNGLPTGGLEELKNS